VVLLALGTWLTSRRIEPYRGEPGPTGSMATARGTVRERWRVAEVWGGLGLARPYLLVAIEFRPPGGRSAILAVDAVDAESVDHLERGDQVELRYSGAAPRQVRLAFGTREFPAANQTTRIALRWGLVGMVGLVAGLRWWLTRRRLTA
jgi:hypothetical protein